EPRRWPVAALARRAVALELVHPVEGDVEPVAALVLDDRYLERGLLGGDRVDAAIDPDAMVEMDHVVAFHQRAGRGRRRRLAVAARPAEPPGPPEDLVNRQHPQRRHHE